MGRPVDVVAYAYPWDLTADSAIWSRLDELQPQSVCVAAAYHAVRAATPRRSDRRIVEARATALYTPVRASAWAGRRVRPADGAAWAGEESFGRAAAALRRRGIPVRAWVSATHADGIGDGVPDLCVTNAFGEVYPYALCPGASEVRDYASVLMHEVAETAEPEGFVIEACGPLGAGHQSEHEKTTGAEWSSATEILLSLCFCGACRDAYRADGADPDELARRVRDGALGEPSDVEAALGDDAAMMRDRRRAVGMQLREVLVDAAASAGVMDVVIHAGPDPWATGPAAAILDEDPRVRAFVVPCWDGFDDARIRESVRAAGGAHRLAAYTTILPPAGPDAFRRGWGSLAAAGIGELHLYHVGLASNRRMAAAVDALGSLRATLDRAEVPA